MSRISIEFKEPWSEDFLYVFHKGTPVVKNVIDAGPDQFADDCMKIISEIIERNSLVIADCMDVVTTAFPDKEDYTYYAYCYAVAALSMNKQIGDRAVMLIKASKITKLTPYNIFHHHKKMTELAGKSPENAEFLAFVNMCITDIAMNDGIDVFKRKEKPKTERNSEDTLLDLACAMTGKTREQVLDDMEKFKNAGHG